MKIGFNENTNELLKPLVDYEIKKGHFEFKDKFYEIKNVYTGKNGIVYVSCSNIVPVEVAQQEQARKQSEWDEKRKEVKKYFGMEVG